MRPSGMLAIILSSTFSGIALVISHAVRLGAIAFTRTRGASSSASARVMPTSPPLEARVVELAEVAQVRARGEADDADAPSAKRDARGVSS